MTSSWIDVTCAQCGALLGATSAAGEYELFRVHLPVCPGGRPPAPLPPAVEYAAERLRRAAAPVPSPATVAAQARAQADRAAERDRVKTVRKRRRLVENSGLASRLDPMAAASLAKLAHPDAETGGAR